MNNSSLKEKCCYWFCVPIGAPGNGLIYCDFLPFRRFNYTRNWNVRTLFRTNIFNNNNRPTLTCLGQIQTLFRRDSPRIIYPVQGRREAKTHTLSSCMSPPPGLITAWCATVGRSRVLNFRVHMILKGVTRYQISNNLKLSTVMAEVPGH